MPPAPEAGEFSIEQLDAANWTELKTLRTEAVTNSPRAFGQTPEEVRAMNQVDWQHMFDRGKYFVIREGGRLVGMICVVRSKEEKQRHVASVYSLYISPEARGKGLGKALIKRALDDLRDGDVYKVKLAVDSKNTGVMKLYEEIGFVKCGERKGELKVGNELVDETEMEMVLQELH